MENEEAHKVTPEEVEEKRDKVKMKEIYQWKDITKDFFESTNELDLGELLHFEMFGLFEAMSAIEMMDKKMDIGMVDGSEKNIPLTFDVAVEVWKNFKLKKNSYWNFFIFFFLFSDRSTEVKQSGIFRTYRSLRRSLLVLDILA